MDKKLDSLDKKVLVEIVKLVQRKGMKGNLGAWDEFLNAYDKKFGSSLSDPARRSNELLAAFLKTFTEEDDLKLLNKALQCVSNRDMVEQLRKDSQDEEAPEQRLVRLTFEHPLYLLHFTLPTHKKGWVITKLRKIPKWMRSNAMVAVDCEMVLCEDGTEALVRVCVVDRNLEVKLDKLVNPNKPVADYRTEYTGIVARDLDGVTCSLEDIQKSMKELLSHPRETILVGHSLDNDLQALKLDHARVIDTSFLFKISGASIYKRPSLNSLCKAVLGYEVQKEGSPHNCVEDAWATMKLVLAKLERGIDDPLVLNDVSQAVMAKLLLHKIPINVPGKELHTAIPGSATIEVKPSKSAQGEYYSAFAVFNSRKEAYQAFDNLKGDIEKDSSGLPQKLVQCRFSKGVTASFYVRKMLRDESLCEGFARKRAFQGEQSMDSKKRKADRKSVKETALTLNMPDDHFKENERRKQEPEREGTVAESNMVKADQKTVDQRAELLKEIERLKQELREKDMMMQKQKDKRKFIESNVVKADKKTVDQSDKPLK